MSVVINNYNYDDYLAAAIDSALDQSYDDVEVVVVDDGSTDTSAQVIESFGERIIAVLKENGGQASAMNEGFRRSSGDLVAFLDADDLLYPDAAKRMVAAWDPSLAFIQCRLDSVDRTGRRIDLSPPREQSFDDGPEVIELLLTAGRYTTAVTSGLVFGRETLAKLMPIPEADFRISADGYLVTLAPLAAAVASEERPWGARRIHGSNLWGDPSPDQLTADLRRFMQHDLMKYKYLAGAAEAAGYSVEPEFGMRDHLHLSYRLVSLRTDPEHHPFPDDSAVPLAWRGIVALWVRGRVSISRKVILSTWFLATGLLPGQAGARFCQVGRPFGHPTPMAAIRRPGDPLGLWLAARRSQGRSTLTAVGT